VLYTFGIMKDDVPPDTIEQAVATALSVDAVSLQPRLYDVIDPNVLVRLLSDRYVDIPVQVSFEFGSHLVTVTNEYELIVQSLRGAEQ